MEAATVWARGNGIASAILTTVPTPASLSEKFSALNSTPFPTREHCMNGSPFRHQVCCFLSMYFLKENQHFLVFHILESIYFPRLWLLLYCQYGSRFFANMVLDSLPIWFWIHCQYGSGFFANMVLDSLPIWFWILCQYGSGFFANIMVLDSLPIWFWIICQYGTRFFVNMVLDSLPIWFWIHCQYGSGFFANMVIDSLPSFYRLLYDHPMLFDQLLSA